MAGKEYWPGTSLRGTGTSAYHVVGEESNFSNFCPRLGLGFRLDITLIVWTNVKK